MGRARGATNATAARASAHAPRQRPTALIKCEYLHPSAEVSYPVGSLLVLAGPSGVGKSTFSERLLPSADILSSDRMRKLISNDEGSLEVSGQAFALLHEVAARRLAGGRTVIIDSTALTASARAQLSELARRAGVSAHLLLLEGSLDLCLQGQRERDRQVPVDVVERQVTAQGDLIRLIEAKSMGAEGFSSVLRLGRRAVAELERVNFI